MHESFLDEVTIEFDGKAYKGRYKVESKMVHVTSVYGSKSTQLGGSTAVVIARMLLRNILSDAKTQGQH